MTFARTKLMIQDNCFEEEPSLVEMNYVGPNPQKIYEKAYELLKAKLLGTPADAGVETLMSRHLTTVSPTMQAAQVASIFRSGNHRQLAVVEGGRLVGQITRRDILRLFAATEQLADAPASALRGPRYMQPRRQTHQQIM